jgi:hypothetical protein
MNWTVVNSVASTRRRTSTTARCQERDQFFDAIGFLGQALRLGIAHRRRPPRGRRRGYPPTLLAAPYPSAARGALVEVSRATSIREALTVPVTELGLPRQTRGWDSSVRIGAPAHSLLVATTKRGEALVAGRGDLALVEGVEDGAARLVEVAAIW